MTLTFKQCTIHDLDALISISRDTFIEAFEKDNNPDDFEKYIAEAFSVDSIKDQLLNPESAFYFAFDNKSLVGYIKLNQGKAQTEEFTDNCIELERIYVDAKSQNKGFGKSLIDHAIKIAKEHNHDYIWLGVWQKNEGAVRFYERYGFEKFGTHPYYIGKDKQIDWLMRLDLL